MLNGCLTALNRRLIALNRFPSRSTNKCKSFFPALKKNGAKFCWDEECEATFQGLKRYLTSPPLLTKPITKEMLFLYLAVSESTASGTLIHDDESIQKPVYYIKSLTGDQTRYPRMKKLVLALFIISRKLRYYFQSFPFIVLTEHPLWSII